MRITTLVLALLLCADELCARGASDHHNFGHLVRLHYVGAASCWKQKRLPSRRIVEIQIRSFEESATRFWPECPEKAKRYLFALAITEGGGNTEGKKADPIAPVYGALHIKYEPARITGKVWGLPGRHLNEKMFRGTLRWDVRIGVLYGAGFLRLCYDMAGGDWQRAIRIFKYGSRGLVRAVNGLGDKPIDSLPIWKHFDATFKWLICVEKAFVSKRNNICNCTNGA